MIDTYGSYNHELLADALRHRVPARLIKKFHERPECPLCDQLIKQLQADPVYVGNAAKLYRYKGTPFILGAENMVVLCGTWERIPASSIAESDIEKPAPPEPNPVPVPQIREPGLIRKFRNLSGAMLNWAKDGFRMATEKQVAARKAICDRCEFWRGTGYRGMGKCMKCGCSGAKLKIAGSACPVQKWGPVYDTTS